MSEVTVKYTQFQPKNHSVRVKTEERMGGQYPLPDMYIPRLILRKLGLTDDQMESPNFTIQVTFHTEPRS